MGKPVEGSDGKFQGSVGDGHAKVPTAIPVMSRRAGGGGPAFPRYGPQHAVLAVRREQAAAGQVAAARAAVDLGVFRADTSFPVPQANSLAKVAAAVDAIADGACTDGSVAHAIGVSPRQGAYYANAAAYLGMVAQAGSGMPREWCVTAAGAEFLNADAATRAEILGHVVAQIPEVDATLNDGEDVEELLAHQMGETTAARRAATTHAWMGTLTSREDAVRELTLETDGVRDRIDGARQVAAEARERARRRATAERRGEPCPRCFTTMPLAGGCPACDG